jgi:integrase/recombinase XerC
MADDLIEDFLAYLDEDGCLPRTIKDYRLILRRVDRELPEGLDGACEDDLRAWLYHHDVPKDRKWSRKTIATYYAPLSSFYTWATRPRRAVLESNPMLDLPCPKVLRGVPRPPSDEQVDAILRAAQLPYLLWIRMAAYQGMRCCEVSACIREDVTPEDTLVRGKGGKQRLVPTDPVVYRMVEHLPPGAIAIRKDGNRCTASNITGYSSRYFDRIGHPAVTMHRLRHWYLSRTLEHCGNLRVVQELAGHSSPASTAIYTLVTGAARRQAVSGLPALGGEFAAA